MALRRNGLHYKQTLAILVIIALLFFVIINFRLNTKLKLPFQTLSEEESCNYTLDDYNTILLAIHRAIYFFENLNMDMLDIAVGTRVLEAQLTIVLNAFGNSLPAERSLQLKRLLSRSSSLSKKVLDNFMYKSNYSVIEKIVQSQWIKSVELWVMPKVNHWRSKSEMELYFNKTTAIKKKNYFSDIFRGTLSDTCIFQQFFCKSLPITSSCKKYFFRKPESSYTLNHQILYAIMAEKNWCHNNEDFTKSFQDVGGWEQFRKDLCGKAFFLANVVSAKNFTPRYSDLFTEQVAVCSLAGYPNFLNKKWLYKILSWQSSEGDEGCFLYKDYDNRIIVTVFSDVDYEDAEYPHNISKAHLIVPEDALPILKTKHRKMKSGVKSNEKKHRAKRHEQVQVSNTGEKCLIHLTSMGIMALSMHLRYSIETCREKLFVD